MCLSIPVRVLSVEGQMAKVTAGGAIFSAGLHMTDKVRAGDYVLLHAGFAIQKISVSEAEKTLRILEEISNAGEELI